MQAGMARLRLHVATARLSAVCSSTSGTQMGRCCPPKALNAPQAPGQHHHRPMLLAKGVTLVTALWTQPGLS